MTLQEDEVENLYSTLELSKLAAEVGKANHEEKLAELEVRRKELDLLESQINFEYQLSGIFNFNRRVDARSMNKLHKAMCLWDQHDATGEWVIHLNSIGGEAFAASGIIDELLSHSLRGGGGHHITIKVRGLAASAAGMILQAADLRVIGPNSSMMIHKGAGGVRGTADDIADEHSWWEANVDQMIDLFLSRTDRITKAQMRRKITRKDWWISAEEAVRLGLADAVG